MPRRSNYRGKPVLYPLGSVLLIAVGVALAAGPSRWLAFLLGVGCLGLLDDLVDRGPQGLRGHALALARGGPSTGALKALGTVALAVYAAGGEATSGALFAAEVLVLSLAAHVGNLLDTRPGRVEKGLGLVIAVVCAASWSLAPLRPIALLTPAVAACAWLTLRERAMLGDTGASLIGGMSGVLLVGTLSPHGLGLALAALIAISLYGEFRSIGAAIERVPLLYRLDSLGRVN